METNNKLNSQSLNSPSTLQKDTKQSLNLSVAMAFARTGKECTKESIDLISSNIIDEYNHLPIETIIEALKKGGRGKYGRTYLLSVQEVCIWIDSYLKENEKEIDNDLYEYFKYVDDHYLTIRRKGKHTPTNDNQELIETNTLGSRNKQW